MNKNVIQDLISKLFAHQGYPHFGGQVGKGY
jgi:hypothetical protein